MLGVLLSLSVNRSARTVGCGAGMPITAGSSHH